MRVDWRGHNRAVLGPSKQRRREVIQEVPVQALVRHSMVVVVVMMVNWGRDGHGGRRSRGAGDAAHGMVGGVWLERVALAVGDQIHSRQGFSPGQQTLIKASKYIALELQARTRRAKSMGNTVKSGFKKNISLAPLPAPSLSKAERFLLKAQVIKINMKAEEALLE